MGKGNEKGVWGKDKGAWAKGPGYPGKGPGSWAPAKGRGKGWGKPAGKGWGGPGPVVVAEAAVVGAAAGIAVGVVAARAAARRREWAALPPQTVVIVAAPYKGKGRGKCKGEDKGKIMEVVPTAFDVCRVTMPAEGTEVRGEVTFFAIDIAAQGGATWRVMRRYNQFHTLREDLERIRGLFQDTKFPGKTFLSCSGQKIEQRRQELEVWLSRTLHTLGAEHAQTRPVWQELLLRFLEPQHTGSVVPTPSAPPAESEALFASAPLGPSAPPAEESLADGAEESANDAAMLEVTVPPEMHAEQVFGVEVPGGEVVPLTLPNWAAGCKRLQMQYSEATGVLVIVSGDGEAGYVPNPALPKNET